MTKPPYTPGQNMPKLGLVDQILYWVLIITTLVFSLSCLLIVQWVQERVAFADDRVIAATVGQGNLNCFYLTFWSLAVFVILLAGFWQQRVPIWGRKDIDYGPPKYAPIYPLLRRDAPRKQLTSSQKKWRCLLILLVSVSFLFSVAMFPRSFYGRAVLLEDGTVEVYDASNTLVHHYPAEEITEVRLDTYPSGKYGGNWRAEMIVCTQDAETFRYAAHCFAGDEIQQLQTMLAMKIHYGALVTIEGKADLPKVIQDQYSDPTERALILELFQ